MTIKEFAEEVQVMRNMQIRMKYQPSPLVSELLKKQEKKVDDMLEQISKLKIITYKEQELFG